LADSIIPVFPAEVIYIIPATTIITSAIPTKIKKAYLNILSIPTIRWHRVHIPVSAVLGPPQGTMAAKAGEARSKPVKMAKRKRNDIFVLLVGIK
jgi:hypothetical protein